MPAYRFPTTRRASIRFAELMAGAMQCVSMKCVITSASASASQQCGYGILKSANCSRGGRESSYSITITMSRARPPGMLIFGTGRAFMRTPPRLALRAAYRFGKYQQLRLKVPQARGTTHCTGTDDAEIAGKAWRFVDHAFSMR